MLSKKVVKDIQSLRLKKHRDEAGLFIAEGPKLVQELSRIAPGHIHTVYTTEEGSRAVKDLVDITIITEAELNKLSGLQTPNGILAVVKKFEPLEPNTSSWIIYLDAVQDPGNFGTIVRIADWFGVKHIVCSPGCADVYSSKVVQATMGSIARVHVSEDDKEDWLLQQAATVYAATLAGTSVYEIAKTTAGILLIGNESKGIRKEFMELAGAKITVPKRGGAESLNAAVATGIILSHLLR